VVRDEHHGGQRGDAAIVVELLAAVVRLGAVAQDLHHDAWIHHRRGALGVSFQLSANHRIPPILQPGVRIERDPDRGPRPRRSATRT
jgi:hypothetical protein